MIGSDRRFWPEESSTVRAGLKDSVAVKRDSLFVISSDDRRVPDSPGFGGGEVLERRGS